MNAGKLAVWRDGKWADALAQERRGKFKREPEPGAVVRDVLEKA